MADEPDETLIDPSPPPEDAPRNWHVGRLVFYGVLAIWAVVALCATAANETAATAVATINTASTMVIKSP